MHKMQPTNPNARTYFHGTDVETRREAHLTKCHTCYGIYTLSPLHAALTMQFAQKEPWKASKLLRLPRKMTMEVGKVLHLTLRMQRIFWKRRKSIAFATQKPPVTRYKTRLNVIECQEVPRLRRERRSATFETSKSDLFCKFYHRHGHTARMRTVANGCRWLRTVVGGCERKRNVGQTHPQTQIPIVKREPLLRNRANRL